MIRILRNSANRGFRLFSLGLFVVCLPSVAAPTDPDSFSTMKSPQQPVSLRGRLNPITAIDAQIRSQWSPPSKLEAIAASTANINDFVIAAEAAVPPELCFGFGSLDPILFTDWETGLNSWVPSRRSVKNADTFSTENWKTVSPLPDGRAGQAAFVANLDTGDCVDDDETGVLALTSPLIFIPANALVPRVAFYHWYDTETNYDGGNLKLRVNGDSFFQIPPSAIEYNNYDRTLYTLNDGNSNPLAGEFAYNGKSQGEASGWVQTWVNLHGLAEGGDTIELRFDFGIDGCDGKVGWYVDELQVYSCSDEFPPPPGCGNGQLDLDEQCDDGNTKPGDGCSNTCQEEPGWECTPPLPGAEVLDPGFELGTPNPYWDELSTNFGTPICDIDSCGVGLGTGPASGDFWAWFGGIEIYDASSVEQLVTIPSGSTVLTFELEASFCDSAMDYLEVSIDRIAEFRIDGSSPLCGQQGYTTQTVDISDYADDEVHRLRFGAETFAINEDVTNFFVDDVAIPGVPSQCTASNPELTLQKVVVNDNGGTAGPANWTLTASGPAGFSGPGPTVSNDPDFVAGTYHLSETGPAGYSASAWVCTGGTQNDADTITLTLGQAATCTITNDDIAPQLTLVKQVVNDQDGSAGAADWRLSAIGPTPLDGPGPTVTSDEFFRAGAYQLKEYGGPSGYTASTWVCNGGSQSNAETISLQLGQTATCTITNDDIDPATVVLKDGFEAK